LSLAIKATFVVVVLIMTQTLPLYRIKNWPHYNEILKHRWSLDIWLKPEVAQRWYSRKRNGKKGADVTYSEDAILICLTIRFLFNLSLRATEGFMQSLVQRLGFSSLNCPSYTQLCRRAGSLKIKLPRVSNGSSLYMAIDSTGLKVYGEGEWHLKMHKASKRRTWRKLHVAIDPVTQELLEAELTDSRVHDSLMLPKLLHKIKDPIEKLWADGAYDNATIYQLLHQKGIHPVIPPRYGATQSYSYYTKKHLGTRRLILTKPHFRQRDKTIEYIAQFTSYEEGKAMWKKSSGYGLRSLVETAIMRFKRTFTDKLRSRKLENQRTEIRIKACILNQMLQLGSPYTVPTARDQSLTFC